jgi:hypothetical protein
VKRLAIALVVVLAGTLAVAYRGAYGSWPPSEPDRLSWCDRTYNLRGSTAPPALRHAVFRAPPLVGGEVFVAGTARELERRERAGEVCGFLLYRDTGDGYRMYSLSGGP